MFDKISESRSAACLVFLIALCIFTAEALVMLLMLFIPLHYPVLLALIDATILVIILSPVLYFCLFRPLIKIIQQRKQAEAELRNYRDRLEELVNERTTESWFAGVGE
jgi:Cu/Ag efflux pump CusA